MAAREPHGTSGSAAVAWVTFYVRATEGAPRATRPWFWARRLSLACCGVRRRAARGRYECPPRRGSRPFAGWSIGDACVHRMKPRRFFSCQRSKKKSGANKRFPHNNHTRVTARAWPLLHPQLAQDKRLAPSPGPVARAGASRLDDEVEEATPDHTKQRATPSTKQRTTSTTQKKSAVDVDYIKQQQSKMPQGGGGGGMGGGAAMAKQRPQLEDDVLQPKQAPASSSSTR